MKTKLVILFFAISCIAMQLQAQSLQVSAELKELIELTLTRDHKMAEKSIDKQIAEEQKTAVRSAYLPKVELGGKYVFAYSSVNSDIGEVEGFESLTKLQEFMQNPAFPVMFPTLAGLSSEIVKLQQLMAQQGMQMPAFSNNIDGSMYGNYVGIDATAKILLYSGGQVPNVSKAISEKIKVQDAMSEKYASDAISEVILYYDQLALLNQSKSVLDESVRRLEAEKKYAVSALNNGFATSFDTLKIAVATANLEAKISEYENKRTLLYEKLSQLTGKPAASFEMLIPQLQPLVYTDTVSDISNRAELRALNAGVEAQKYLLKAEKSHYLPKVQALASVRYDNIFNATTDFSAPMPVKMNINNVGLGPTVMAGVGFKWELFDRSGGTSRVKQTTLEIKKAENARDEAYELLQLNQVKVRTTYQITISQIAFKEKQRLAARMALDLAEKSYRQGMINITERLATETEMQNTELEYLQAIFAQRQSAVDCCKATGKLTVSNLR